MSKIDWKKLQDMPAYQRKWEFKKLAQKVSEDKKVKKQSELFRNAKEK